MTNEEKDDTDRARHNVVGALSRFTNRNDLSSLISARRLAREVGEESIDLHGGHLEDNGKTLVVPVPLILDRPFVIPPGVRLVIGEAAWQAGRASSLPYFEE